MALPSRAARPAKPPAGNPRMRFQRRWAGAPAMGGLFVRGGPPLAYVGGYGLAVAARTARQAPGGESPDALRAALAGAAARLARTRPTADDLRAVLAGALKAAEVALAGG